MNQITDTTEWLSFEDRKKEKTANDRPVRLTPVPQSKETIWERLGEKKWESVNTALSGTNYDGPL